MPNRLIHETSPYLQQHAHNPVDWYPWGEEALAKAKLENKVILVSIGYSACHWCHVMERESFENGDTAALMNEYFINIKIDREERPDLDQVYMDAIQLLSGSGGWPLNVFLTPDRKPFYGGTYYPPVRAYNRSSWTEVITAINQAWTDKPGELLEQAESLTSHLQHPGLFSAIENTGDTITTTELDAIAQNLVKNADTAWGGFGGAPKFPQTFSIGFLLRQAWYNAGQKVNASLQDNEELRQSPLLKQALLSLDKMIMGGIYDQLAGGFARYSTDAQWLAPHFEKMLYDNALLIGVISEAYQLTGRVLYRQVIEQTMKFIAGEWQDDDHGFFSAFDADSEGKEGKFYTWQKAETEAIISDPETSEIFNAYYDVTEEGNWEHTNILWVKQPLEIFCRARGIDEDKAGRALEAGRGLLLQERNKRVKPLLDDKKLMSWNAMMITACCKAWAATGIDSYLQMAIRVAGFIESKMKSADGIYHHNYKNGKAFNHAFLDDLALYIEALCYLQEGTGDVFYLNKARELVQYVIDNYAEDPGGFFYFTPVFQRDIIFRKKEVYDGATASGNSVMAQNLLYLGIIFDLAGWREHAAGLTGKMRKLATTYSSSFGNWAQVMQLLVYGYKEIAIVGNNHHKFANEMLEPFWPNKLLQHAATNNDSFPLMEGKRAEPGETSIFLCTNYSCQAPVNNTKKLFEMAGLR